MTGEQLVDEENRRHAIRRAATRKMDCSDRFLLLDLMRAMDPDLFDRAAGAAIKYSHANRPEVLIEMLHEIGDGKERAERALQALL